MLFNEKLDRFLKQEMCIDTRELFEHIHALECVEYISDICAMIESFFVALEEKDTEGEIQKIFESYEHLFEIKSVYATIDSLRHAFDGFAYGGLHQLYTKQEREVWYPKVILTQELVPNDIGTLDEIVKIFRGCGADEHRYKKYGQSWSTSKSVAQQFAYVHYQNQSWFNKDSRIVLQSTIPRAAIFYSDQNCELEVVVNVDCLGNIRICE